MNITPNHVRQWQHYAGQGLGLLQLGLGLSREISQLVEGMHGTISHAPLPFDRQAPGHTRGLTRLIYRLIHDSFGHLGQGFGQAGQALIRHDADEDPRWILTLAAVNGIFGDRLAAEDSPLAIPMRLHWRHRADRRRVVIFLHGLCMSEHGWAGAAHASWVTERSQSADIAALRYNSGLHISDNGQMLAQLLESSLASDQEPVLIGHSMGGLLARSALAYGQEHGHDWPKRLAGLACLGSPHHGAPLERLGNQANGLFEFSPYIRAFARLGELRSAGIRDLRHGNLHARDHANLPEPTCPHDLRQALPLPPEPAYLLLAASRSRVLHQDPGRSHDDYLVPVNSALGLHRDANFVLSAPRLRRATLADHHHMHLLHAPAVYQHLNDWYAALS